MLVLAYEHVFFVASICILHFEMLQTPLFRVAIKNFKLYLNAN